MSLYEILIEMVQSTCSVIGEDGKGKCNSTDFVFDLDNKSVRNKKFVLIENGNLMHDEIRLDDGTVYGLKDIPLIDFDGDFYEELEELYKQYYLSVPGKRDSKVKANFKAINPDELTLTQLKDNMRRTEARVRLEAFILLMSLSGKAKWQNDAHYFWMSQKQSNLVLFKQWIV